MALQEFFAAEEHPMGPSPDAEERIQRVLEKYKQNVNPGLAKLMQFGGFGDVEAEAEGCTIRTLGGNAYLDFLGGYGVFALGHRHPRVVDAVKRQLDRIALPTKTFFNEPLAELASRLAALAPGDLQYAFFSNSGTEAVEAALKMARVTTGRAEFVTTEGSYHGKTLGALSVTGREKYRKPFEPLLPGATFIPFNDVDALRRAVSEKTAAVILEPLQGEGGINVATPGYLRAAREICDAHGALLIADEVQTGMGRTGRLFGIEHEGVVPDILTLAKALGGGVMPIGATLGTPRVWEATFGENPLLHTSTFGGNQLACAAALAALDVIADEHLTAKALVRGEQLMAGLREAQAANPGVVKAVRGMGLMVGVEFEVKDAAELTINLLAGRGIVAAYTLNNPNVIRFEPPLIVTQAEIAHAVEAFGEAVALAGAMLADLEE